MKRCRHGLAGAEQPGLIDGSGALRDLSGAVADTGPATLGRDSMSRLAALREPRADQGAAVGCAAAALAMAARACCCAHLLANCCTSPMRRARSAPWWVRR